MKSFAAVLSLCLWHIASATPVMPPNSTTMYPREPLPSNHPVEPLTGPRAIAENILAAVHKARAAGRYANNTSSADEKRTVHNHNYTAPGAHFFPTPRDASLKSHCKQNSTSFVDTTAPGSPPTAHCAALVDQILRDNVNQTCVTFGFAPNSNNDTARHSSTTTNLIASSGKCAFSVTVDTAAVANTFLGIGDIVFVVQESIRRFSRSYGNGTVEVGADADADDCGDGITTAPVNGTANARVGGAGAFECSANGTEHGNFVNWALVPI
ncbi:hypothetical protein F5Y00DRAFT_221478 [Daldinia vernicosa]|uniref:uncharacterized protein n=1 Tax=Daldinia vernicosa TaxID=114800 RepID=UPI002007B381|nr:uncharacterized protein F5Y00DRAFT_221478 [Daldinia vernicosa]KAI0843871.1 hypothetical protein F5Y00DRAFT_221478 [Daldinia vernicosa]